MTAKPFGIGDFGIGDEALEDECDSDHQLPVAADQCAHDYGRCEATNPESLATSPVSGSEVPARSGDRHRLPKPLRWLRNGLSSAADRLRTRAMAVARRIRTSLSRALNSLIATIRSPARFIKSVWSMVSKDRGFGFWWLVATIAIAVTIGLLVALVLSPVVGILAALIVGIWILVRRARSARSGRGAGIRMRSASLR